MKRGCGSLLCDLTCSVFWRWGGTLKTNTSGICGVACGVLITLGFPLTNVTCPPWVHPAHPPGRYMRALSHVGPVFHAQMLGKGIDHDWLYSFCSSQVQNLRWLVGRQGTVLGGSYLLCSSLVSTTQFSTCARAHSLRCAMCLLMVGDPRLSWSWPMWTVHELRNSSLANFNQLRAC